VSDWLGFAVFGSLTLAAATMPSTLTLLLLPTLAHEGLMAVSFLLRDPPRRTLNGVVPCLAAYGASFWLLLFIQAAVMFRPEWLAASANDALRGAGVLLWMNGAVLGLWPLWYLRRAFSLEPVARGLVTRGPYRFARHPIYAGYLVQYLGMWLVCPTLPFAIAIAAWVVMMLTRVRFEERVLSAAHPAYAEYRQRVGRFASVPWASRYTSFRV